MAGPGTTFTGPVMTGTKWNADGNGPANTGLCVLMQSAPVTFTAASPATTVPFILPYGAQLLDILADTTTAWNTGGTTPAATLTVGKTAAGADYAGGMSVLTAGRLRPTYTAAQLAAQSAIGANTTVYATVTQTAASGLVDATAGSTIVTLIYAQTVQLTAGEA